MPLKSTGIRACVSGVRDHEGGHPAEPRHFLFRSPQKWGSKFSQYDLQRTQIMLRSTFQASLDHPGPRGDPDGPGRDRGAGQRGPHQGRAQLRLHPHQTRRMVSYEAHDQTDNLCPTRKS